MLYFQWHSCKRMFLRLWKYCWISQSRVLYMKWERDREWPSPSHVQEDSIIFFRYIPLASSPLIYMFFSTHNAKTATLRYIYVFVDLRDLRRFIFCKMHTQAYCNDSQFWLKVDMKPKNETYINLIGKLQPAFDWGITCMQYAALCLYVLSA